MGCPVTGRVTVNKIPTRRVRDEWGTRLTQSWSLEKVPEVLVVNVVVILHLRRLHKRSQQARAAIR